MQAKSLNCCECRNSGVSGNVKHSMIMLGGKGGGRIWINSEQQVNPVLVLLWYQQ